MNQNLKGEEVENMEDYKSNSHASKEKEKNREEKKVEKIISGNAKAKKKASSANSLTYLFRKMQEM